VSAEYGALPEAARLRTDLARAFGGDLDIESRLAERESAYPRRRGITPPPPRVTIAPGTSQTRHRPRSRAHDAPGLLHRIGWHWPRPPSRSAPRGSPRWGAKRGRRVLRRRQGRQTRCRRPRAREVARQVEAALR